MALLGNFTKQPAEVLDFDISYATVLAGRSDVIVTKATAVTGIDLTGTPLTVSSSSITGGGTGIKVVVAAGVDAKTYTVTVTATSNATPALVYEDEVTIVVEET
jgi:hypothetical protein